MSGIKRRDFVGSLARLGAAGLASGAFPPVIQKALAVTPSRRTGTVHDVEHVVILMQENRSFDHYFGTLAGVRGFGDPFPIPLAGKTVWCQPRVTQPGPPVLPFHLRTKEHFELIRVQGLPHSWKDAQGAWANGRMHEWTRHKKEHAMGYFAQEDLPFQWALANAFTLCDAYHCSIQAGTNPNRIFQWTGTNDPSGRGHGPAIYNDYDSFDGDPGAHGGYTWTTYPERLEQAGVSWQIYENMDDNFTDNPLAGFKSFRDAWFQRPGFSHALRERGVSTRDLDLLAKDVLDDKLPQVSWIVATAEGSEHPGPSSPAQGADYTARVLAALTANPEVWSKTVLFLNFDENDGFFDHVPPPAPPARGVGGGSTVSVDGEYHEQIPSYHADPVEWQLLDRPYGLGPRVPLYVVSPWTKGGWVSSEVFDHTSVLRFLERRFGVKETNISPWRRAVCGDLVSLFDFAGADAAPVPLPDTQDLAKRASALPHLTTPPTPPVPEVPVQEMGARPSRALPYRPEVKARLAEGQLVLAFGNGGTAATCLHVYDKRHLDAAPRRYTVEPGKSLSGVWTVGARYELWILGQNGFHRHLRGAATDPFDVDVTESADGRQLHLRLVNASDEHALFRIRTLRYGSDELTEPVPAHGETTVTLTPSHAPWYDYAVTVEGRDVFGRRFAGRIETGRDSFSDPAMGGPAVTEGFDFSA